jgi:hypothetical protein
MIDEPTREPINTQMTMRLHRTTDEVVKAHRCNDREQKGADERSKAKMRKYCN